MGVLYLLWFRFITPARLMTRRLCVYRKVYIYILLAKHSCDINRSPKHCCNRQVQNNNNLQPSTYAIRLVSFTCSRWCIILSMVSAIVTACNGERENDTCIQHQCNNLSQANRQEVVCGRNHSQSSSNELTHAKVMMLWRLFMPLPHPCR